MKKNSKANDPTAAELAAKVLDILLEANLSGTPNSRKSADSQLNKLASAKKSKIPVAVAGNLSSKIKTRRFVDVHLQLKSGATLTISLSGKGTSPPILPLAVRARAASGGGHGVPVAGTIVNDWTKTVNGGLPDEQGDSTPD